MVERPSLLSCSSFSLVSPTSLRIFLSAVDKAGLPPVWEKKKKKREKYREDTPKSSCISLEVAEIRNEIISSLIPSEQTWIHDLAQL